MRGSRVNLTLASRLMSRAAIRSPFRLAILLPLALGLASACERNTVVVTEKTPPVRDLAIEDPRDGVHLNLTWTKPSGENLRGIRLLRRAGEPPLSATDSFSQVAYEGAADHWSDEGYDGAAAKVPLVVGTTYHYAAYALYGENEFSAPARAEKTLHFFGPVKSFEAHATDAGAVELSWALPDPKGDIAGVRIERARGAAPGTAGALDAKQLYEGTDASFRDATVVTGTHYFYAIRTFDAGGTESARVVAEATTRPGVVTNLQLHPTSGGRIDLSWTNPADERFSAARVVRKIGADPAGPTDGVIVCDAPGATTCSDHHPDPAAATHYGVFAHDAEGAFASGVFAHATASDPVTKKLVRAFGGLGGDWIEDVATGGDGAIVIGGRLGYFAPADRTASFGTSSAPLDTSTRGTYGDGFVVRYLADGTPSWVRTVSSTAAPADGTSEVTAVAVLPDGSVLAAGKYFSAGVVSGGGASVTLQPFGPSCAGFACSDVFLAKWSASGTLQWARRAGSPGGYGDETVFSIVPQADGGAIVAGVWDPRAAGAHMTFGDGAGSADLTSPVVGYTPFVARYDANGNVAWVRGAGGSGTSNVDFVRATGLSGGAVLLVGAHGGALTLGSTTLSDAGHFLARVSSTGTFEWVQPISQLHLGGNGPAAAVMPNGDLVLASRMYGVGTFGTGGDAVRIGTEEKDGGYLARYDASGRLRYVQPLSAEQVDVQSVVPQPDGGCVLSGLFTGTVDLGPEGDRLSVPGLPAATGGADYDTGSLFLARFDAAGSPLWARTSGTAGRGASARLALRGARELVLAGAFSGDPVLFQGATQPATLHARGDQSPDGYARDDGLLLVLDDATP